MNNDQAVPGSDVAGAIDPAASDHLRSVVGYTPDTYTIHYMRTDVADHYTSDEISTAIEELRLETLEQQHVNSVFSDAHGCKEYSMTVFADAVELNFILGDGRGVEVAFDPAWIADQRHVIDAIQQAIE